MYKLQNIYNKLQGTQGQRLANKIPVFVHTLDVYKQLKIV